MNCRQLAKLVERYVDNELGARERTAVEQHLEVCPGCTRKVDELLKLQATVKGAAPEAQPPEYWAAFSDRFWAAWHKRRRTRMVEEERPVAARPVLRWATFAAAGVVVVLVGVVTIRSFLTAYRVRTAVSAPAMPETTSTAIAEPKSLMEEARAPAAGLRGLRRAGEPETRKQHLAWEPSRAAEAGPNAMPVPRAPSARAIAGVSRGAAGAGGGAARAPSVEEETGAGSASDQASVRAKAERSVPVRSAVGAAREMLEGKTESAGPAAFDRLGSESADTLVHRSEELQEQPVLDSMPESSAEAAALYAGARVPVWVLVEKDGSVSQAEARDTENTRGADTIALKLARSARFRPGRLGGRRVRAGVIFTVTIAGAR